MIIRTGILYGVESWPTKKHVKLLEMPITGSSVVRRLPSIETTRDQSLVVVLILRDLVRV